MKKDDRDRAELVEQPDAQGALVERPGEPPIVARLVVEIRSDGSRTIARGAMEDVALGKRVGIEAEGATPMALALQLAKAIFATPALGARGMARALLGARKSKPKR